jgi:hypothetical protein
MRLRELLEQMRKSPGYCRILDFLVACKMSTLTRILRHSLLREVGFENIETDTLVDIFNSLEEHLESTTVAADPISLFQSYLVKERSKHPRGRSVAAEELTDCSRVIRLKDLHHYNVNNSDDYVDEKSGWPSTLDRTWKATVDGGDLDSSKLSGWVGGSFFWVTKTAALRDLRDRGAGAVWADRVRDALGMGHLGRTGGEDSRLVEQILPKNLVGIIFVPTLFDSDWYPLFRPAKEPDGWGRAVDLADFGEGLPQAIRGSIDWHESITIVPLGELTVPPWQASEHDLQRLLEISSQDFHEAEVWSELPGY